MRTIDSASGGKLNSSGTNCKITCNEVAEAFGLEYTAIDRTCNR
jgi:hypothetical protein